MGGVEYSTLALATTLDRDIYAPIIIAPEHGPLIEHCRMAGIPTLIASRPRFRPTSFRVAGHTLADPLAMLANPARLLRAADNLYQVLRACSPGLVLTKGLLAHFYGGIAARRAGAVCIWHVQDEVPAQRAGGCYLHGLQLAARLLADTVIGDSVSIAAQFPNHPRVYAIHNGIDTAEYAPETTPGTLRRDLGIPNGAMLIGNLARLTDWKGQHVLIEAFSQVASAFPMAHLVLIGSPLFDNDGYERRLRQIAASGAAPERVHFAGYRTDTAASLACLDIYAHPSVRKDTAPLALLSALASGLPTVISDVAGMLEVVDPGTSALVVPVGDVSALSHALRTMLSLSTLCERLSAAARASAISRFSIQAHTRQMSALFDRAIARRMGTGVRHVEVDSVV